MKIDLFEFARQERTASGSLAIADLVRVDTPDRRGSLGWTALGSIRGRHGAPRLSLEVDGAIVLVCQRCLQPMSEAITIRSTFLIASDEAEADLLDQDDDYDVVVGSATFDLDALIEDEVILTLPSAPRHAVCPDGATDESGRVGKPSPFAALAAWRPVSDSAGDEDGPDGDVDPDADR